MLCYRPQRMLLIAAISINVIMLIYLAYLQDEIHFMKEDEKRNCEEQSYRDKTSLFSITVVIREFEDFENDVPNVVLQLLQNTDDNVLILIISDKIPYPPLTLNTSDRVKLMTLDTDLNREYDKSLFTSWISSEYIVIVPDGVRSTKPFTDGKFADLEATLAIDSPARMVAWPIGSTDSVKCMDLNVDLKKWTLQYFSSSTHCSAISGKFVLAMRRDDLFQLSNPFSIPIKDSLFIQTAAKGWKIIVNKMPLWTPTLTLYENPHSSWKHRTRQKERVAKLYKSFGIKLVQKTEGDEEWFGCSKTSERCFGTIHNDMPEYLYRDRWTPPCCLKAVRTTARHVFRMLERHNVRYWLEGGSLLGAARNGDIIPWDYDVDIGIYKDDIPKSSYLTNALQEPYEDEDGFVWETATEGEFFRVQYSSTNRLHVDIFPFYSKNGTMTKDTWFKSHRQDIPFPEYYLKPLTKIGFVGTQAFAPNNWKTFLDLKFGKGAIDNPKYPDSSFVHH